MELFVTFVVFCFKFLVAGDGIAFPSTYIGG